VIIVSSRVVSVSNSTFETSASSEMICNEPLPSSYQKRQNRKDQLLINSASIKELAIIIHS
jgi:hypothetical protein